MFCIMRQMVKQLILEHVGLSSDALDPVIPACCTLLMEKYTDYESAKLQLDALIGQLNPDDLTDFGNHLIKKAMAIRKAESADVIEALEGSEGESNSEKPKKTGNSIAERKKQRMLEKIRKIIRPLVPPDALAPNEKDLMPSSLAFEGYTLQNTLHVDAFLYNDDEIIDEYCDKGFLARDYCSKCGSRELLPLNYISHSISDVQARFIYEHILPSDMSDMCIVDVGSRLGVLLYYGFLFSNAPKITGVEFNPFFADIQNKVITRCGMSKRLQVIVSDIREQKDLLAKADVVFLNNVFDAFIKKEEQLELWKFVLTSITKKGTIIISIPPIEEALKLEEISKEQLDVTRYFTKTSFEIPLNIDEEFEEEISGLASYKVN